VSTIYLIAWSAAVTADDAGQIDAVAEAETAVNLLKRLGQRSETTNRELDVQSPCWTCRYSTHCAISRPFSRIFSLCGWLITKLWLLFG